MSLANTPPASPLEPSGATPPIPLPTLAAVIADLGGDIPLERILTYPPIGTATEADLIAVNEQKQVICELINGTLVAKAMGSGESELAYLLGMYLLPFVKSRRLGVVLGADGAMRFDPRNALVPDVAFVSWDRMPNRQRPQTAVWGVIPDLAIEVWNASNRPGEMRRKRERYFASGVRLVWEFHPRTESVVVYTSPDVGATLDSTQTLDGGDVLPGFTLSLAEFYAALNDDGNTPSS
ncbi:MAG TPA: Uma2 family endonuclease [Pirellulales bacterium]